MDNLNCGHAVGFGMKSCWGGNHGGGLYHKMAVSVIRRISVRYPTVENLYRLARYIQRPTGRRLIFPVVAAVNLKLSES
jgi:hypothetical protein